MDCTPRGEGGGRAEYTAPLYSSVCPRCQEIRPNLGQDNNCNRGLPTAIQPYITTVRLSIRDPPLPPPPPFQPQDLLQSTIAPCNEFVARELIDAHCRSAHLPFRLLFFLSLAFCCSLDFLLFFCFYIFYSVFRILIRIVSGSGLGIPISCFEVLDVLF